MVLITHYCSWSDACFCCAWPRNCCLQLYFFIGMFISRWTLVNLGYTVYIRSQLFRLHYSYYTSRHCSDVVLYFKTFVNFLSLKRSCMYDWFLMHLIPRPLLLIPNHHFEGWEPERRKWHFTNFTGETKQKIYHSLIWLCVLISVVYNKNVLKLLFFK